MYWNSIHSIIRSINVRWIVTLDVLKYHLLSCCPCHLYSWIVTLDVLKWDKREHLQDQCGSWIVTLDVLKSYGSSMGDSNKRRLNSNIRCIEIHRQYHLHLPAELNSNIRCIEICKSAILQLCKQLLNSNIRCIEISLW